jgi:pimeloyl-ACP methyl ester carboxylesterase
MTDVQEHHGWLVRETGPPGAEHGVLLLPGALASAVFYDDLLAQPSLRKAPVRFVATTLPGFGGTPPLDDPSMDTYARQAAKLAADMRCDVLVGHSLGANVALEMVVSREFTGPVVLLSPSFSRGDESIVPRTADGLARVFGHLPYSVILRMLGPAMRESLPPARRGELIAALRTNDPRFLSAQTRRYLEYLDRHVALAPELCMAGTPAFVVFGGKGDVGLTPPERAALLDGENVRLITIDGAGHFTLNVEPARVAEIVLDAVAALPHGQAGWAAL